MSAPESGASTRSAAGALALCCAFAAFVVVTPPGVWRGADEVALHGLNRAHLVAAARAGRLPLWNPHVGLGRPFAADSETAVFYPPSWLAVVLGSEAGLVAQWLFHAGLAGFGTAALARGLGAEPWPACLAGALFASSGPLLARGLAGQMGLPFGLAWLPLVLAFGLRLRELPSLRAAARLASALALQFLAGHPQASLVSALGLAAVAAAAPRVPGPRVVGLYALVPAWSAALAAIQVLPTLELLQHSNRAAPDPALASAFAMPWAAWASLAVPPGPSLPIPWENAAFAGVAGAVAGLAALFARWPGTRILVALVGVGVVFAAGDRTPVLPALVALCPPLGAFRIPARAAVLVSVALAVAAAGLLGPRAAGARAVRALVAAVAVTATAVAWAGLVAGSGSFAPRLLVRLALVVATGIAVAGVMLRRSRATALALAGVVACDMALSGADIRHAYARASPPPAEPALARWLLAQGLLAPGAPPPRVSAPPGIVRHNAGLVHGWSTWNGYNALSLERVYATVHARAGVAVPSVLNTEADPRLYERGARPFDDINSSTGYDLGARRWVAVAEPDPRLWVAGVARRVAGLREALAAIAAGHDVHAVALVEAEPGPSTAGGNARLLRFEPERLEIEAAAPEGGWLVVGEAHYPGWTAEVDGQAAPCVAVNAWMRGVRLAPGRHLVVLRFRSTWLATGALVSGVAALAAAWAALASTGRSPAAAAPPDPAGGRASATIRSR